MAVGAVPPALRERLGELGTEGLLQLLETTRLQWKEDTLSVSSERFERRLSEECAELRVEMAQGFAQLRQEMGQGLGHLRQEMIEGVGQLRQEMTEGFAALRTEMHKGFAEQRSDAAGARFEMLKWAFLFWVGQFFAVASLMAVLIRFLRLGT